MAKLPPIKQRAERQLLCLMYKKSRLLRNIPSPLEPSTSTRSSDKIKFEIPAPLCERYKHYPMYKGAQLWNSLTAGDQRIEPYATFKKYVMRNIDFNSYPV